MLRFERDKANLCVFSGRRRPSIGESQATNLVAQWRARTRLTSRRRSRPYRLRLALAHA